MKKFVLAIALCLALGACTVDQGGQGQSHDDPLQLDRLVDCRSQWHSHRQLRTCKDLQGGLDAPHIFGREGNTNGNYRLSWGR
jgi:hypothetical protein